MAIKILVVDDEYSIADGVTEIREYLAGCSCERDEFELLQKPLHPDNLLKKSLRS